MTGPPDHLTDRPDRLELARTMDPLSALIGSVRLTGGVFLDARFSAPWCVTSQITAEDCRPFMAAPAQIVAYHVVTKGRLLLVLEGGDGALEVNGGEIVLLPRNHGHTLASALGLQAVRADDLIQSAPEGGLARIVHGGGGEATHLVCGFLGCEAVHNPLLAALPPVLKLDIRQAASRDWVEASVRFAARALAEGQCPSSGIVSRLSELLFVEAVRAYVATLPEEQTGWLKGVRDPYVGRALALLHSRPNEPWTAETIAKQVGLSRSAFNDRFAALIGMAPIRYLTHWRLQLARDKLRDGRATIAQIAHAVGYESEVAFNRAFKRQYGEPPARWRRAQSSR